MVAPPVIMSRIWGYSGANSDAGRAHLGEYGFDLVNQVRCSIVGVRGPVISQPADGVTVRVRVVRIKIDIVHEGRQIWGEWSRSYGLLRWQILVLLGGFEGTTHCPIRVQSIGSTYASGEGNVARSASQVASCTEKSPADKWRGDAGMTEVVVHEIENRYPATATVASRIGVASDIDNS